MTTAFVRQLGAEAGVQLNPLVDRSEIPANGNSDQVFGILMRATRGRIDKPFKVHRGNVRSKLGKGEQIRLSALNEAWVHVVEALNNGAYEAVVQRMSVDTAVISYANVTTAAGTIAYTVDTATPAGSYVLSVKHLGCHNDGIKVEIHAEEKRVAGLAVDNDIITLIIRDSDDDLLFEFAGSLDPAAKDDYGNSSYLPNIISSLTDEVEVTTGDVLAIEVANTAYGYDVNGAINWSKSPTLVCFNEVGTGYVTQDYVDARTKLEYSNFDYAYLASGGSQSLSLLGQMAQLAFNTNKQFRFDIGGSLTPDQAIAFVESLNFGANATAHLLHAYWSPLKSDDPTGINGNGFYGVATLNIAYACGRNARTNAKGFAPKNFPIAGREWPINRLRVSQSYAPKAQELNAIANAKINPCLFEVFTGGGRYVFRDSLTSAPVSNSSKKLIAVADMSASIDDTVTRFGKDVLQLPMQVAINRMRDYLTALFENAQSAGWVVPSSDPALGGKAFMFEVKPNDARPYDRMDVNYWVRYDGTVRQVFVTQTLTR